MAVLSAQQVVLAGLLPTYGAAAAGGDEVRPGDTVFLHVKNASAGAITVTVVTPGTAFGQTIGDVAVSVPAAGERMLGPISGAAFASGTTGMASITYSAVATVTVAALVV